MLAGYDAIAIAEVMGLEGAPVSAGPSTKSLAPFTGSHHQGLRDNGRTFVGAPTSAVTIEAAVEQGLPRAALRHVAEWLAGDDATRTAALEWAVVPKTTLERRTTRLSVPESERTERIARLAVQARRALGSNHEARAFMTTPHPELDDRDPLEAARTDLGARRVERILFALEYGLAL